MPSCKKDEQPYLNISNTTISFGYEGGAQSISFETNMEWTVMSSEIWCTLSPSSGNASTKSTTINVLPNNSRNDRICRITFVVGNVATPITIHQEGIAPWIYTVEEMGTLANTLTQTQKDTITTMVVRGKMNKADFGVMKYDMPNLMYVDLSNVQCENDRLPHQAFGGRNANTKIAEVVLPRSITAIGEFAFYDCSALSGHLTIPEGVTTIEESAYAGCTGLSGHLLLPSSLKEIGASAFKNCKGLKGNLMLPDAVTTIGWGAFWSCEGLSGALTLPKELTTLGGSAFSGCKGLDGTLTIPQGVETIESSTFFGCYNLSGTLTLPEGLLHIGTFAFQNCSGLKALELPSTLTRIDGKAFAFCEGLIETIAFPKSLQIIDEQAFWDCKNISGIVFDTQSNLLKTIGKGAFKGCNSVAGNVMFPQSVEDIKSGAFYDCKQVAQFQFPHTTPPTYYYRMLPDGATIKVPAEGVDAYKSADGWREYVVVGF